MLRSAKKMKEYSLGASDGRIGHIDEFYFDDSYWTMRYVVAQAGNWLTGRMVLLSPHLLGRPDEDAKSVPVNLTQEQIRACPSPESERPVNRQFEEAYYRHFGWPYYWAGPYLWGPTPYPIPPAGPIEQSLQANAQGSPQPSGDPHLRSTDDVTGYHLRARDGEIGHVEDFLYDDQDWSIRYLVAGTRNWRPGKMVLVPPAWIGAIHWEDRTVDVDAGRDDIRLAPAYDPGRPMTPEYAAELSNYFAEQMHSSPQGGR
ncbi:MAG: PRC-barrel domain containing protein [Fibrobacteres bacterium]|nr:PRC-barrel domain containing protein [Fibrobacterota bacterium]